MAMTENWQKSTRSAANGACVEARWKKATKSGPNCDNCVEVRADGGMIQVRDTKDNGAGPILSFTPQEWDAFIDGVKKAEFDLPA